MLNRFAYMHLAYESSLNQSKNCSNVRREMHQPHKPQHQMFICVNQQLYETTSRLPVPVTIEEVTNRHRQFQWNKYLTVCRLVTKFLPI